MTRDIRFHTKKIADALFADMYRSDPVKVLTWSLEGFLGSLGVKPEGATLPDDAGRRAVSQVLECYGQALDDLPPFTDIWGPVYMEAASRGHKSCLGQFFTPQVVARAMAAMTGFGLAPPRESGRLLTTCDPASGSGVMMLSAAQEILASQGKDALLNWSFTCCDLDYICSLMSAVQMLANCGAHDLSLGEVVVYNGNSLLPLSSLRLIVHASAPGTPVVPAMAPERLEALQAAASSQNLFPWYADASNDG